MSLSKKHYFLILFIALSFLKTISSQEKGLIFSTYHSPSNYKAGSQNWAIARDNRGILYFGNSHGILEYDGKNWELIKVKNKSAVKNLKICSNNTIYVSAYNEIGYLSPNHQGKLNYTSLTHLIDSAFLNFGDVYNIHCFSDTVFFSTHKYIFRYHNKKLAYWEAQNHFLASFKINNDYYIQETGKGILKLENNKLNLTSPLRFFSAIQVINIFPHEQGLLMCTKNKGLFLYKEEQLISISKISENAKKINDFFCNNTYRHGCIVNDTSYVLCSTFGKSIFITKDWHIKDIIDKGSVGIKSPINYAYSDGKLLWLALSNGISQIELLSPFRYWNHKKGINGAISAIAKLNENLYVATCSGIYFTNFKKTPDLNTNHFNSITGDFEKSWSFLSFHPPKISGRGKTTLLLTTNKGLFQITNNKLRQFITNKSIYSAHQYKKNPNYLFLGVENGIETFKYANGIWERDKTYSNIKGIIHSINEDTLGNLWANSNYKGLYKINEPTIPKTSKYQVEFFDTLNNIPSVQLIKIYNHNDSLFFKANKHLYTYNQKQKRFKQYKTSTKNTRDILGQDKIDNLSYLRLKNKFISNYIPLENNDKGLWFATRNKIYRYYPNKYSFSNKTNPTLIRKVLSNDSIIYYGTNFLTKNKSLKSNQISTSSNIDINTNLKYENNSLTFFYSSPFFEKPQNNKYSYYLEGFDTKWSPWTSETKKEYTNLRDKKYTFKVKSKNIYNQETDTTEFHFTILPPWYRSILAYITFLLLSSAIVIIIIWIYTKRLINEKYKLEKIVIERTQEILIQKEEILAQSKQVKEANAHIIAKNKKLEQQKWEITNQAIKLKKVNIELQKLSEAISKTNSSVAIFDCQGNLEWVNEGFIRLYGYTLEEYKQKKESNIIEFNSYPNIQQALKSSLKKNESTIYKFKTQKKGGSEIWVQTTLTHVLNNRGERINIIAIDSDVTDIIKAENKIAKQRDKLAISNATKNKFFKIIAHDLRNPISTLANSSNIILKDFEDYDKAQTKDFISELNKLSLRTYNLLENLLDWSSTQMGEINFNPQKIDLNLIISENIELINYKILQKNLCLKLDVPKGLTAFADENMIKTVFRNLLSNALKFTPQNGIIFIRIHDKHYNFLECTIEDTGIGIDRENLSKLFKIDQHYTRLGLENERGSGLGLILCKEFIEKNGGKIIIDSTSEKGTSITFTLKKTNLI